MTPEEIAEMIVKESIKQISKFNRRHPGPASAGLQSDLHLTTASTGDDTMFLAPHQDTSGDDADEDEDEDFDGDEDVFGDMHPMRAAKRARIYSSQELIFTGDDSNRSLVSGDVKLPLTVKDIIVDKVREAHVP